MWKHHHLFLLLQVQLFLSETWIEKLTEIIRSNLENIGKGWFNINETCWDTYKMSCLSRMIAMVHYKMQDSLRFLVQDSLLALTQLLLDACHSVLLCPQNLVWGNNLITSPYKYSSICTYIFTHFCAHMHLYFIIL